MAAKKGRPALTAEQSATNDGESKREKFVRIGSARLSKAVHFIDMMQTLANKAQYEYTAEDIDAIVAAIQKSTGELIQRLKGKSKGPAQSSYFK